MKSISALLTEFSYKLLGEKSREIASKSKEKNLPLIERAKQDWIAAISLFNNVSEAELIDHAIFNLNAAERRYVFLLKEARREQELKKEAAGKEAAGEDNDD